ncbi:histidine--tRNA ligase [Mycoplasma crocodyli]|uniref:Histidine--tRNA ligase n=1 Tax=Mycoplasma crocodyli (strain ATCC 51981 / MP145) TaxID=512564 RepID=D5E5H2_MYCCM|nr:histidine--tRNA ligase [Mycoplasma crocodyli]ADE19645.1 histidine--tRNA ligase [Mycoplasma crocodyli MP145]
MYSKVKGTIDYNQETFKIKHYLIDRFSLLVSRYDYQMIETPILEHSDIFKRSAESSDIVNKEMYEFKDKGDRDLVLRPEGTASFIRAYIENKWYALKNQKFSYVGPMFRYEQPQKGRFRQFYQAGVEFVGPKNPLKDLEVIKLAVDYLSSLNLKFKLVINSIGDNESRSKYENALRKYLIPFKNELSEIGQKRLEGNVLRILDDKVDSVKPFMKKAPKISSYLSDESKKYFLQLSNLLSDFNISFQLNNKLVRGLDYYDEIVFEFVSTDPEVGSQSTLIGGGRYSNLIKLFGGDDTSSVGFGLGIDRILPIKQRDFQNIKPGSHEYEMLEELGFKKIYDIYFIPSEDPERRTDLYAIYSLFASLGLPVIFEHEPVNPKKIYEKAQKSEARFTISELDSDENEFKMITSIGKKTESSHEYIYEDLPSTILQSMMDHEEKSVSEEKQRSMYYDMFIGLVNNTQYNDEYEEFYEEEEEQNE